MIFLFVIHDGLRRELFWNLCEAAKVNGINTNIICFSLREYYWFLNKGYDRNSLSLLKYSPCGNIVAELNKTIDVAAGFVNIRSASNIYHSTYNALTKFKGYVEDVYIFGGNGLHAFDKAILKFKTENKNIYSVFTELSNIDGKLFFDSQGSNASSYFYELLEKDKIRFKKCNSDELTLWKSNYCNDKFNKHIVKQATKKSLKKALIHRLYGLAEFVMRLPSYQRFKIGEALIAKKKVAKKLYINEWEPYSDSIDELDEFVLFPLQVFGDSQIKLHSKISNELALDIACEEAKKLNLPLIVKPHPAEPDAIVLTKIIDLKRKKKFLISTNNTFSLIKSSKKVVVINSTVGLEAIICNKDVTFLGATFYKYFSNDDILSYYLNDWLVDIDIFNPGQISHKELLKIINIAKNKHHA